MSMPTRKQVELALLEELDKAGGKSYWKGMSPKVLARFPDIPRVDLAKRTPKGSSFWEVRRLKAARTALSRRGEIVVGGGYWEITPKGRSRLQSTPPQEVAVSKLIAKAGGQAKLAELLNLVDAYVCGEILEAELAKGIRRLHVAE